MELERCREVTKGMKMYPDALSDIERSLFAILSRAKSPMNSRSLASEVYENRGYIPKNPVRVVTVTIKTLNKKLAKHRCGFTVKSTGSVGREGKSFTLTRTKRR